MQGAGGLRTVLTHDADKDLAGITVFTLDNFGAAQADRYIAGLQAFLLELPHRAYRLKAVQSRTPGYWRAVYQSHVIFARKTEDSLLIVRILHDKMSPDHYLP